MTCKMIHDHYSPLVSMALETGISNISTVKKQEELTQTFSYIVSNCYFLKITKSSTVKLIQKKVKTIFVY